MRAIRVLHESSSEPLLALERDRALYAVAELDRWHRTQFATDKLPAGADFHTRLVSLGGAGLDYLDRELLAGLRPAPARLQPGSFTVLPPLVAERCTLFIVEPGLEAGPSLRVGCARAVLPGSITGHAGAEAPAVALPPFAEALARPGVAALVGDDLWHASEGEAASAIVGLSVFNDWGASRRKSAHDLDEGAVDGLINQMGPILVNPDSLTTVSTSLEALRVRVRVGQEVRAETELGAFGLLPSEAVAFVSQHVRLRAGDVIATRWAQAPRDVVRVRAGQPTHVQVEGLGVLSGTPIEAEPPVSWRRQPT